MKRIVSVLLLFVLFASLALIADKKGEKKKDPLLQMVGDWTGSMKLGSERMTLVVHIVMSKNGMLVATVDSPTQRLFDLPAEMQLYRGAIGFVMPRLSASFRGQVTSDSRKMKGYFSQGDAAAYITLVHSAPLPEPEPIVNDEPDKPAVTTDFLGDWIGELPVGDRQVRIVLHIRRNREGTRASVDSPDQDTFGIHVDSIVSEDKKLTFSIPSLKANFEGTADDTRSNITGTFTQDGKPRPLIFTKS